MPNSILIASPDNVWTNELQAYLKDFDYNVDTSSFGKDCQLKIYRKKYDAIVLDLDLQEHNALSVLLYLKFNAPSIRIILTVQNKTRLDVLELDKNKLKDLGAKDILIKPFQFDVVKQSLEDISSFESWKEIKREQSLRSNEPLHIDDFEFTRVAIADFFSGNTTIYDCFIRIGHNKYIKILQKGEYADSRIIEHHQQTNHATHIYFKTKDRNFFINFINELLSKMNSIEVNVTTKTRVASVLIENFIDESYTVGISEQLLKEGLHICENTYNMLKRSPDLLNIMTDTQDYNAYAHTHLLLTTLYATAICFNIEWCTRRSIELVALGALLHDIGMKNTPQEFLHVHPDKLTPAQFELVKNHPKLGFEILDKYPFISEPVKQIVYQHHELMTGTGYPNGLTGNKIYPLAKIVALADAFSISLVTMNVKPLQCLKKFVSNREIIMCYEPEAVKALIKCFM